MRAVHKMKNIHTIKNNSTHNSKTILIARHECAGFVHVMRTGWVLNCTQKYMSKYTQLSAVAQNALDEEATSQSLDLALPL